MRAAKDAPRDPSRVLERRHGHTAIVERGGWVLSDNGKAKSAEMLRELDD